MSWETALLVLFVWVAAAFATWAIVAGGRGV